jgi:hypothetical protein
VYNHVSTSFFFTKADPKGKGMRYAILAEFIAEANTADISLVEVGDEHQEAFSNDAGGKVFGGKRYMALLQPLGQAALEKLEGELEREVYFYNERLTSVEIYWKDVGTGALHPNGSIEPGDGMKLGTYAGHVFVWIALDKVPEEKGEIRIRSSTREYHMEEKEAQGNVHQEL